MSAQPHFSSGAASLILLLALGFALLAGGCSGARPSPLLPDRPETSGSGANFSSTAVLSGSYGPRILVEGEEFSSIKAPEITPGLAMPDGRGGVVWVPGEAGVRPHPGYADARELRLKVRELAEQLAAGIQDSSLRSAVALPVSFVNLDNMGETSGLGRYIAEQIFHEFNQRGFPVREYRIPGGGIATVEGRGEFYLSRALQQAAAVSPAAVVVAGTYYSTPQAIFINARLLRPADGRVLRTASLLLPANDLTRRMTASAGMRLEAGTLRILDYKETIAPSALSPFDRNEDIH
ncbi:MAG: hypothetical protein LBO77_07435 [Desulfovibrio sp.]|jgi:TolB-like protein|nr:hypothetical protein [Desulfovibrio sp.]